MLSASTNLSSPKAMDCSMDTMVNGAKNITVQDSMRHLQMFSNYRVVVDSKTLYYTPFKGNTQRAEEVSHNNKSRSYKGILNPHGLYFKSTLKKNNFYLQLGENSKMYFTCTPSILTQDEKIMLEKK